MKFIFAVLSVFFVSMPPCLARDLLGAGEPGEDQAYNVTFGFSPFDGFIGFEYQYGKHSFGIGAPGRFSYRHYADEFSDSLFWGVYLGQDSYDENNETVDGHLYRAFETEYFGFGMGKRWQWPSGWHVNLSAAIEHYEEEYSNPEFPLNGASWKKKEEGFRLMPGFTVGYKF
ncbi:MAG TPA: hypothetical protein VFX02_04840 [Gammaproteobacteria bacterium]|nr:hypothetical protein [Gammaproteobacteria bacterium]